MRAVITHIGRAHRHLDGKWAWRIKAANGQIVATDGGQGYETRAGARATVAGHDDGPIEDRD